MNILFLRNYPSVDGLFTLLLSLRNKFKQTDIICFYIDFGVNPFLTEIAEHLIFLHHKI